MTWDELAFNSLYPDYDKMSWEDKKLAEYDKEFLKVIAGEEITEENFVVFQDLINASTISHEEAMRVFNDAKLDKYFQVLYPEFDQMSEEEQNKAEKNKAFIGENIRDFEYFLTGTTYSLNGITIDEKRCKNALRRIKHRDLYNTLYTNRCYAMLGEIDGDYILLLKHFERIEEELEQLDKISNGMNKKQKINIILAKIRKENGIENELVNEIVSMMYKDSEEKPEVIEYYKRLLDDNWNYFQPHIEEAINGDYAVEHGFDTRTVNERVKASFDNRRARLYADQKHPKLKTLEGDERKQELKKWRKDREFISSNIKLIDLALVLVEKDEQLASATAAKKINAAILVVEKALNNGAQQDINDSDGDIQPTVPSVSQDDGYGGDI